jgi:type IV secretory pathway TraG/TraD family ATPase VirD4
MKRVLRGLVTFISGVAAHCFAGFFVLWADAAWLRSIQLPEWVSLVFALGVCAIVSRYVWTRTASAQSGIATSIIMGALIVGGVSFVAGFVGAGIFMPDNNLGPLLGIFAGPLGFVAGGVGGCIYWLVRR